MEREFASAEFAITFLPSGEVQVDCQPRSAIAHIVFPSNESPQPMSRLLSVLSLSALIMAMLFVEPAIADKRVALVVGNGTYRNVARLDNPVNDAKLLADTLRDLGFALVGGDAQLDLDKASFDRAVQDFGAQLQGADVGLFFYAGHGVQVRGTNYLIPVDANPTREANVDFQMLDTNLVMRQMEGAGTRLNLVILDACRNNPFGGRGLVVGRGRDTETVRLRDTSSGLAQMQAPEGTLISFATQPGSVARDGIDGHSPYSKALAETIRRPGLGIFDAFNQVGLEVKRATGGAQQPWVSSSPIDGTFYFVSPDGAGTQVAALPPRPPPPPASVAAPAVATSDVRRFDGVWVVDIACGETEQGVSAYAQKFFATIGNGVLRGQVGPQGKPGGGTFDGAIEPDGSMVIIAKGITGPNARPKPNVEYIYQLGGRLEGSQGSAIRFDRSCDVKFAKQSAGARSTAAALSAEPDVRPSAAVGALPPSPASDEAAWNLVRGMKNREALQAFIRQFPASAHRPEAEILIAALPPPAPISTERPKADRPGRIPPAEPRANPGAGWSCSALYRGCEANCAAGRGPGCVALRCVPKRAECLANGCWKGLRFNGCGVTKS